MASIRTAGLTKDFGDLRAVNEIDLDLPEAFFGLHTLLLGYLVYKSSYFPRFLGILMVLASFGYLVDSFGNFLLPQYDALYATVVVVLALLGELPFALWLLIRGVNVERWEKHALESV